MRAYSDHSESLNSSTRSTLSQTAPRPLPLKQRTSSIDARRDYSVQTVFSLLGLLKAREYFITVDNFSIWRRHLAWAIQNGADLRSYMTQRFASSMVFMSLLLGAELNVLFNSAAVTTSMRRELFAENFYSIEFWAGMTILVSVILTILSLISTFTAWGMVSSVSDANAHCILRSSIGQYVAELPGRFIVTAVNSFLIWVALFFFLLLPVGFWSILLLLITAALFFHVVVVFSAFGRIIMHTGAMGTHRIFDEATEKRLLPHTLHSSLLEKAKTQLASNTSIMRQYRKRPSTTIDASGTDDFHVPASADAPAEPRMRADSNVRFADTLWTSVSPRENASTPLSDIASVHDAAETASSQVSLASSSDKMERPKRPPRPAAVNSSHSEGSTSFLDALGGSNHSLDEWLKASGTSRSAKSSNNKSKREKASYGRRGFTPVGVGLSGRNGKPRDERQSVSPVEFSDQSREGRKSISPIDSDTSGHGDSSRGTFWRPPASIPVDRPLSAHSSINGSNTSLQRHLTEEEKFDEEYGELSKSEEAENLRTNTDDSQGYEVELGHEDSDLEQSGQAEEQQRLLPGRGTTAGNYAAVATDQGSQEPLCDRRT